MKRKYKILITLAVVTVMFLLCTVPAFALTESEVQDQVNSAGRESVTGNVWVWFLCAIAFLKVSQKIDSFNMMNKSHIGWCDFSWNPITGCKKDCDFSYGKRQTRRLCGTVQLNKSNPQIHWNKEQKIAVLPAPFHTESDSVIQFPVGFSPAFHPYRLKMMADKQKPANIYVCSRGEMFGEWIPLDWITAFFDACKAAPWHNYMFLTKNPNRYEELAQGGILPTGDNFWYGTRISENTQAFVFKNSIGIPCHPRKICDIPLTIDGITSIIITSLPFRSSGRIFKENFIMWEQNTEKLGVTGHRGCKSYMPENTLISFSEAFRLEVDVLEFDVQMTRDGVLVIMHDSMVDRTTDGTGAICFKTLAEVKALDAGVKFGRPGTRVPTMDETLQLIVEEAAPTLLLNVEIKDQTPAVVDKTMEALHRYGLVERSVIASFDAQTLLYVQDYYPEIKTQGQPPVCMAATTPVSSTGCTAWASRLIQRNCPPTKIFWRRSPCAASMASRPGATMRTAVRPLSAA